MTACIYVGMGGFIGSILRYKFVAKKNTRLRVG